MLPWLPWAGCSAPYSWWGGLWRWWLWWKDPGSCWCTWCVWIGAKGHNQRNTASPGPLHHAHAHTQRTVIKRNLSVDYEVTDEVCAKKSTALPVHMCVEEKVPPQESSPIHHFLSAHAHTRTDTLQSTLRCLWAETLTVCYKWLKKNHREKTLQREDQMKKCGEKKPVSCWVKRAWSMLWALITHVLLQYVHG